MLRLLRDSRATAHAEPPLRPVDDLAGLVTGCRRGDRAATSTLLTAVGPSMLQMMHRGLGGADPEVEDVFQESMMALLKALPSFRGDCSPRRFGCRIATSTALKARQRRRVGGQAVLVRPDEDPSESADHRDWALASCWRRTLRQLLDHLPESQADALVLHCIVGLTVEEVAVTLGAAVETRLAYAGLLRAIWYPKLWADGKLRLLLSADLGAGLVRFPVGPQGPLFPTSTGELTVSVQNTIPRTDTRPMGLLLFGGSAGLLWHLTGRLALACETRILSGLPDWGFVIEGQASFQVAFGGGASAASSVE